MGGLEELLAALGVDDAPVFAEYVQSMVTDAAESEEELPEAVESAVAYVEELAGLEDAEGDERLGRIAEELKRHWQEARQAQEAEQQTDRATAASAASLETIQSAMRAYREEDESSSKQQQHHHHQTSEDAAIIKAATLARANASSSSREAPVDEDLAADLGPAIDNRAGGKASGPSEVQKKQEEQRKEHIRASNEVRKAKKEAEEKKKAHRMNMSDAKLKASLKGKEETKKGGRR